MVAAKGSIFGSNGRAAHDRWAVLSAVHMQPVYCQPLCDTAVLVAGSHPAVTL